MFGEKKLSRFVLNQDVEMLDSFVENLDHFFKEQNKNNKSYI